MNLKYIITDFDGTLVNTVYANVAAYRDAFNECDYEFSEILYNKAFGLRFDDMCDILGVPRDKSLRDDIRRKKHEFYNRYFNLIDVNAQLLSFISTIKENNPEVKTAIASTASKDNLYAVLRFFEIENDWDVIVTGDDVLFGKPNPEVYNITKNRLGVMNDNEVIVFEDTEIGCKAAYDAGIKNVIKL